MAAKQQQQNPFADWDFTKMMGDFKVPGVDMNSMMETQRKNFEALSEANNLAMEGMQAVAQRQAEILRQGMEEMSTVMQQMMAAGAPQDRVAKQSEVMKSQFEKMVANMRELSEMLAKSNTEAADVLTKRISNQLDEMKATAQKMK
jgi:phasin family protein